MRSAAPLLLLPLLAAACDMSPLTREQLFGPATALPGAPDATAPPDTAPPADATAPTPDTAGPAEAGPLARAPVSGQVIDRCTGEPLDALVGLAGRHTCSIAGKASYFFGEVPVGVDLTLTAYKKGYQRYGRTIRVPAQGLSAEDIQLVPEGGCAGPRPATEACVCREPTCVRS